MRTIPLAIWLICAVAIEAACSDEGQTIVPEADVVLKETSDDHWGDLVMRFIYDGRLPMPAKVLPPGWIGDDERLVVNAKNHGIKNIVVWLYRRPDKAPDVIHPMYQEDAKATVEMTAAAKRFEPHVVLLRATQTLKVVNADVVGYNVDADFFQNAPFNWLITAGNSMTVTLPKAEHVPTQVSCNIHPWMSAYLFVRDDPYAAVSNEDGVVRIDKLPVGKWSFKVWHEVGYIKEASLGGKETAWPRGAAEFEIHPGTNDMGEIKLRPKVFERR